MSESNPFQSPAMETAAAQSPALRSQIGRCRLGVVVVMIVFALFAVAHGIVGFRDLLLSMQSGPGLNDNPLFSPMYEGNRKLFRQLQFRHAIGWLIGAAACITIATFLFGYSRRLHQAASGSIRLDETLRAQAACWLIAAVVALGYLVGQFVVW